MPIAEVKNSTSITRRFLEFKDELLDKKTFKKVKNTINETHNTL